MVALLDSCDVTSNDLHLGFHQELRNGPDKNNSNNGNEHVGMQKRCHEIYFNLLLKEVEKTYIFTQKWLDYLLLMTSYLVTIETDNQ